MNFAATTSLRNRAGGRPATNSILRRLPALVTSASLTAMLFVTTAAPVAATTAPVLVQAQGLSGTVAEILWSPVASATGTTYKVYRNGTFVGGSPITSTIYDDTGRTANTAYTYTVTAIVSAVESSQSAPSIATTQGAADIIAPTFNAGSLTYGTLTSSSAVLQWPHASDNVGVVGFRIMRGEDAITPVDIITTDVALTYTATNLKADQTYTFQVLAIDAADNASAPLSTTFHTPPMNDSAPSAVTSGSMKVTAFSATRIDISWGTVAGAVGYQIYRDGVPIPGGEVDEPASPWFSDNGLTTGTTYSYTIVAFSSEGNPAPSSPAKTGTTLGTTTVKIVRGPTAQWVGPTSARVAWWTNIASPSVVNYGTPTPGGTPATDNTNVQNHVVLLAGLTPGTAYQYNVGNGAGVTSGTAKFTTSPPAGTSFSFDAIGDYGAASAGQQGNANRIASDSSAFLQTLGDNVYSEASDPNFTTTYSEVDGHWFKQMQAAFTAKALWTANGNKEYYGHGTWFNNIWAPNNEKWYSYDWGDAHFLVIDSSQPFDPASAQYAWALADLQAHQASAWRIAVIQDPPYSSTSNNSSSMPVEASLVPLFQAQGVQLVLSGNSHNYERSKPLIDGAPVIGGITYMVSGNGGNAFNPFTIPQPSWSAFRDDTHYGYLKISVSAAALVINEVSALDGSTLDTTTINAAPGATYVPITPVRLLDSRFANGLSGKFNANTPRTFQVTGRAGIPAAAVAVTGNLTVTNQTVIGAAYLGPDPIAFPTTSTLNFPVGDNRGNALTVALSAAGKLSATYMASSGTTDLVFDVTGYFLPDQSGATYFAVSPARLLDSRFSNGLSGPFTANVPRTFQVTTRGGVPANATAVTGNLTVTNQTKIGAAFLGPDPDPNPPTSTLNFPVGDNRGNALTVALSGTGSLSLTYMASSGTSDFVFDVTGYFVPDTTGASFVPLTPARLLDSRSGNGLSGKFVPYTARTFQVSARGGVTSNAVAVTGNLTVTNQTVIGAAYLGPDPINFPSTSTLNFPVGDNRGNSVDIALSAPVLNIRSLSLTYIATGGNTDFVFDVTGYFVP